MTVSAIVPMTGSYDYSEVARSILIAIAASYAALDLTGRVAAANGRVRLAWLSGGAMAMGIGIWTMHLKGMLAFGLPVPVEYHWPTLLAGLSVAIFASAVALYVTSRQNMTRTDALTGSIVMSAGIAGLHYTLMAAMRMPAITRYSPFAGGVFHPARSLIFSNRIIDGVWPTPGDQMECSAKAWQRHRDGNRNLRHALHRYGCRKFLPRAAPRPLPHRKQRPHRRIWSCHCDFARACGRHIYIVRGQAGTCRNPSG